MATTFSTAKTALDEIGVKIQANRSKLEQAKALSVSAESDLNAMTATYGQIVADIDAAAASAPNDIALQHMKAEKDKLVAEFTTLRPKATDMKNATAGITF